MCVWPLYTGGWVSQNLHFLIKEFTSMHLYFFTKTKTSPLTSQIVNLKQNTFMD